MSLAQLVPIAIKTSLVLVVFVAGLRTKPGAVMYLFRNPTLFARSVLSMNIVMPLLALWIAIVFRLPHAVELSLIALSISPVPPFVPGKLLKAGADAAYAVSLVVMAALLALITVPVTITALGALFGLKLAVSSGLVFGIIGGALLLPLGIGVAISRLAPTFADRLVKPANTLGLALLLAGLIPVLFKVWPAMKGLLGDGTLLAILALTIAGLAIGHLLGGPIATDRPVLAVATASRHPAVAIAILHVTNPNETLVPAAVLLDLIVVACVAGPYLSWALRPAASASRLAAGLREPKPRLPRLHHGGGGGAGLQYKRRQDRQP